MIENIDRKPSIQLKIERSLFLRLAPVLLWVLAVFLPMLIGSRVYFMSLQKRQQDLAAQSRQHLMARAQQLTFRLQPKTIARSFFTLDDYEWHFVNYRYQSVRNVFENLPLVKALPDFEKNIDAEVARFSRYLQDNYRFKPEFILALDENQASCSVLVSKRLGLPADAMAILRIELTEMCQKLNDKDTYGQQTPRELRHYREFPAFNQMVAVAHPFNTRPWRLDNRFSARLDQNIYLVTMSYPVINNRQNYLLLGFTIDNVRQNVILDRLCDSLSDEFISLQAGRSSARNLPLFIDHAERVELLTSLPPAFEQLFKKPATGKSDTRIVIKLTSSTDAFSRRLKREVDTANLLLLAVGCLSLLATAGLSMGRFRFTAGLTRIITASFVACMTFPLTAIFWQGLLQHHSSSESDIQNTMHKISRHIRELDQSFLLQSYRRMLLLKFVADSFEKLPVSEWGRMARLMFSDQAEDRFSDQFRTYYLYDALDREFYRGQVKTENQALSSMSRLFVGVSRKLMMQIGAMSGLSEKDRTRIGQIADFASGLMEQLLRPKLLNKIYRTQGELYMSDFMARRSLLCSHFLRQAAKITGYLIFVTENYQLMESISAMQRQNLFPTRLNVDDYLVDLVFYPIDDYAERGLNNRIVHEKDSLTHRTDNLKEIANSLYAGADFNQINNLHLNDPHLIVTDRIFNNNVFVFAMARPLQSIYRMPWPLLALSMIAVISCLALAGGVAKMLLLQIPPFLAAMREIENDRYDWQLNLSGSDEFSDLAGSINSMRVSLFERRKMMQLVSASAIEAARSDLQQQSTARRRDAAILFCDIRSFTTISERRSAEEVVDMLNSYFSCMCPIIEAHGGFIDKLIGDAIQAVFLGEPSTAVLAAARSALQMRAGLDDFNRQRRNSGLFTIENGIGIAAGTVVTGLVGSQTGKLDAALLGKVLHKAQTLESKSRHAANTRILLDHTAWQSVREMISVMKIPDPTVTSEDNEQYLYEITKIERTE
jgi:class 3 adenylate cyclase